MSKYTTEVRFICENLAGKTESVGQTQVDAILDVAAPLIFDFNFPMFDEAYRLVLEKKILRHYYTREISEETVGLWKLRLEDRMNIIMPYYNKLYESETFNFNPLYDVDVSREHETKNKGQSVNVNNRNITGNNSETGTDSSTGTTSENASGVNWEYYSDTPQGGVSKIDVDGNNYLTNATKNTNTSNESGTETQSGQHSIQRQNASAEKNVGQNAVNSTENYIEHVTGKQGTMSYSKMIAEYRNILLNIDAMIIEELSDLFFGLW